MYLHLGQRPGDLVQSTEGRKEGRREGRKERGDTAAATLGKREGEKGWIDKGRKKGSEGLAMAATTLHGME